MTLVVARKTYRWPERRELLRPVAADTAPEASASPPCPR